MYIEVVMKVVKFPLVLSVPLICPPAQKKHQLLTSLIRDKYSQSPSQIGTKADIVHFVLAFV